MDLKIKLIRKWTANQKIVTPQNLWRLDSYMGRKCQELMVIIYKMAYIEDFIDQKVPNPEFL